MSYSDILLILKYLKWSPHIKALLEITIKTNCTACLEHYSHIAQFHSVVVVINLDLNFNEYKHICTLWFLWKAFI